MTVRQLVNKLLIEADSCPAVLNRTVYVYVPDGSVGATPGVVITHFALGFDGDSGKCVLYPEKPLRHKPKRIVKKKVQRHGKI